MTRLQSLQRQAATPICSAATTCLSQQSATAFSSHGGCILGACSAAPPSIAHCRPLKRTCRPATEHVEWWGFLSGSIGGAALTGWLGIYSTLHGRPGRSSPPPCRQAQRGANLAVDFRAIEHSLRRHRMNAVLQLHICSASRLASDRSLDRPTACPRAVTRLDLFPPHQRRRLFSSLARKS